jgi:hypothetical protein
MKSGILGDSIRIAAGSSRLLKKSAEKWLVFVLFA